MHYYTALNKYSMKKISIFLIAILWFFPSKSNPIIVPDPPIIDEIYFDSYQNWTIEFNMSFFYSDFSLLTIESSAGTLSFKPGIITNDSVVVITSDSLQTPLYINPEGDYIKIIGSENDNISERYFFFGNYEYSYISAINSSQSYVLQADVCSYFYYLIKENSPTPGYVNPYYSQSYGTFTGNIFNCYLFPISNARIKCRINAYNYETHPIYDVMPYDINLFWYYQIQADNGGHFTNSSLYGRNYLLTFYTANNYYMYDTSITVAIEPDSINTFDFILNCDSIYVGNSSFELNSVGLFNYPNPISSTTTISWQLKNGCEYKNAVIKVFSYDGDLIRIIPVPEIKPGEMNNVTCDFSNFSQGNYYYNLEIDGKKIASNHIVVIR